MSKGPDYSISYLVHGLCHLTLISLAFSSSITLITHITTIFWRHPLDTQNLLAISIQLQSALRLHWRYCISRKTASSVDPSPTQFPPEWTHSISETPRTRWRFDVGETLLDANHARKKERLLDNCNLNMRKKENANNGQGYAWMVNWNIAPRLRFV